MHGYFINLERSADRRKHMLAQAGRFPGSLQRFEAVNGDALTRGKDCLLTSGQLGCFLSHYNLISTAPRDEFFCVFEDDVILSNDLSSILTKNSFERLADFDIVWLDCTVIPSNITLLSLWKACRKQLAVPQDIDNFQSSRAIKGYEIFLAAGLYLYGLTAYIVTPRGRERLPSLLKEALDGGPPHPVDTLMQHLSRDGRIDAAVLVPFLATPQLDSLSRSTIESRKPEDKLLRLIYAIRRMFFAGTIEDLPEFVGDLLVAPNHVQTPSQLLAQLSAAIFELGLAENDFSSGVNSSLTIPGGAGA